MASIYFLGESGYSGDLVKAGAQFDFGDQPIFCLACLGEDDSAGLDEAVANLKRRHRVALSELKAAQLHSRPRFVEDLLDLLAERRCQLFIEVVEKRFMVAINLVNHQLLTGAFHVGEPIFEAQFWPVSYGFRPGRSTHGALEQIRLSIQPRKRELDSRRFHLPYPWVIEGDIKGCFDNITRYDRCAHTFMSAICIAAAVIFWL